LRYLQPISPHLKTQQKTLSLQPPHGVLTVTSLQWQLLLVQFQKKSCPFLCHEYGRNKSRHWQSSLCQCKATYSGMLPGFPEAPIGHITRVPFTPSARIKATTHNTLGLGSWSTVSYLFRDRPATRTGPRLSATRRRAR
jgi:hypothetical protein